MKLESKDELKELHIKYGTCYYFDLIKREIYIYSSDILLDGKSYKTYENITDSINLNFARVRIDSYDSLPMEKMQTFHNVKIFIKSVVNENHYYYNIFLEKGSYKKTQYF